MDFLFADTLKKTSKGLATLHVFASHLGSEMKKITFSSLSLYVANKNNRKIKKGSKQTIVYSEPLVVCLTIFRQAKLF